MNIKETVEKKTVQPKKLPTANHVKPIRTPEPKMIVHDMSRWEKHWALRDKDDITDICVHHTVMAADAPPSAIDAAELSQGSLGAGYNYYITADGTIYVLRPLHVLPAAAYGRNGQSVNIALGGDFTKALPTKAQKLSLFWLVEHLTQSIVPYAPGKVSHERFKIKNLYGHREVAFRFYPDDMGNYATACPGNTFYPYFRQYWVPEIQHLTATDIK